MSSQVADMVKSIVDPGKAVITACDMALHYLTLAGVAVAVSGLAAWHE